MWKRWLTICGLLFVTMFWVLYVVDLEIERRYAAALHKTDRVLPLNGVQIDLSVLPHPPQANQATILFLLADSCRYCQEESPIWARRIRARTLSLPARSLIISKDGHALATDLSRAMNEVGLKNDVRILERAEAVAFAVRSGFMATPIIALIDEGGAVRFVSSRLTDTAFEALTRAARGN